MSADFGTFKSNLTDIFDPFAKPDFINPVTMTQDPRDTLGSIDQFALAIALEYTKAVALSPTFTPRMNFAKTAFGNMLNPGMSALQIGVASPLLFLALSTILKNQYTKCQDISYKSCIPLGACFVGYWTPFLIPYTISPVPMHPPQIISPLPGCFMIDPGFVSVFTIAAAWWTAKVLGRTKPFDMLPTGLIIAILLQTTMKLHFSLDIKGLYFGLHPGVPPFPFVYPWFGLR